MCVSSLCIAAALYGHAIDLGQSSHSTGVAAGKEAGVAEGSGEAPPQGLVSAEAEERLQETPELDYLTHIVMRLFENKRCGAAGHGSPCIGLAMPTRAQYDSLNAAVTYY